MVQPKEKVKAKPSNAKFSDQRSARVVQGYRNRIEALRENQQNLIQRDLANLQESLLERQQQYQNTTRPEEQSQEILSAITSLEQSAILNAQEVHENWNDQFVYWDDMFLYTSGDWNGNAPEPPPPPPPILS